MTTETILAECARVEELDKSATPGPWLLGAESGKAFLYSDNPGIDANVIVGLADVSIHEQEGEQGLANMAYLAHSRTFSPRAARALRIAIQLIEQLKDCDMHEGNCASIELASKRVRNLARLSLAEIAKQFP